MTTIVDLDTGQVLGVVDGRDHKGVGDWLFARPLEWRLGVQVVDDLWRTGACCARGGWRSWRAAGRGGRCASLRERTRGRWRRRASRPGASEGLFHVEAADPAALNAALDKARAAGALLVELKRDGQDLEAVLASTMGAAA